MAADAPAGPATPYVRFSMTKIVTATAVVRLADEGRLDLDAPSSDYFTRSARLSRRWPASRTDGMYANGC